MLGLECCDACFRQLRTEAKFVLLFTEGVAAEWLERDRGQLATQAGYAGIHGASSLVALTLCVPVVSWPQVLSYAECEAGAAEHLALEVLAQAALNLYFQERGACALRLAGTHRHRLHRRPVLTSTKGLVCRAWVSRSTVVVT
ncbi:hypothetical protein [Streptomyces sp. NPDC046860]|uniref:hypothetical protein n=1 Tax=Streptomyces sp. NPDC046860 TaxID=3154495 RepID=UPI0033C6DF79